MGCCLNREELVEKDSFEVRYENIYINGRFYGVDAEISYNRTTLVYNKKICLCRPKILYDRKYTPVVEKYHITFDNKSNIYALSDFLKEIIDTPNARELLSRLQLLLMIIGNYD